MKSLSLRKAWGIFIRVFFTILSFTFDVKVRADVVVKEVAGKVEIEKAGALIVAKAPQALNEPLDVETFGGSRAKFQVNALYVGAGERTLISCFKNPSCDVSWGVVYFASPAKDAEWFTVRTPQCEIQATGGEFILEVRNNRTTASVISGQVTLKDRASGVTRTIRPGFSNWVGGLLASGTRSHGRSSALDFADVMILVKNLGVMTDEEWQHRHDSLRVVWKNAVESVAQENQDQVTGDMQILSEIDEARERRLRYENRKRVRLVKEFRKKIFEIHDEDEPDSGKSAPSGSIRAPANSAE